MSKQHLYNGTPYLQHVLRSTSGGLFLVLFFLLTSQISYLKSQVVSVAPAQNALNVSPSTTIQVTFAVPMDTTTMNFAYRSSS